MSGEFNRQSGASREEANWQGWTPPWMAREGQGPRGPFGFGRGFGGPRGWQGPRGPFGHRHGFGGPRGHFGPGYGPGQHWSWPGSLLSPARARSRTRSACHNCAHSLIARIRSSLI